MDKDKKKELFDRREALVRYGAMAVGGVLGSLLLSGCRSPEVYRDFPQTDEARYDPRLGIGPPTGYLVDPRYCTRCGDCLRVCRCEAVGGYTFNENDKPGTYTSPAMTEEESDKHQCWIYLDKCCACGRCYRVCDVDAITPCYGDDKKPYRVLDAKGAFERQIPAWKAGMPWGFLKSEFASKDARCCINDEHGEAK